MILTSLIIAAAATVAVGGIFLFWDDIKEWLYMAVEQAQKVLDAVVVGAKVYIKKIDKMFQEIIKIYQQDQQGQWHQTTVTKMVSESEVPPEILAKAKMSKSEVDISMDVERELTLSL